VSFTLNEEIAPKQLNWTQTVIAQIFAHCCRKLE